MYARDSVEAGIEGRNVLYIVVQHHCGMHRVPRQDLN